MTHREAFKAGFLLGCADLGLSGPETAELTKTAAAFLLKDAGLSDTATQAAGSGLNILKQVGIGLPIAAGAGVGYLAHKALHPDVDADDVRKHELIQELRHFARQARERQRARGLQL